MWRCLPLSLRPVSCLVTDATASPTPAPQHLVTSTHQPHSHGGPVGTKPTIHLPWITSPMASAGFLSVGRRPAARSNDCLAGALPLPRAMGAPVESCVCRRSQSALPSHFFGCDDDGARESLRACWAIPTDTVLSCTTMTFLSKPTFLWSKPTLSLAHNYFLVKTYFISLVNSYFLSDAGDA